MAVTEIDAEAMHFTPMGTLIRKFWTSKYYQDVLRIERVTNHRICGASTKTKSPCRAHPKEEYGYYCNIHQADLTTQGNSPAEDQASNTPNRVGGSVGRSGDITITNYEQEKKLFKPVMTHAHLRKNFHRCNNCLVRAECAQNIPGSHCTIEEDMFNQFLDAVRHDYDIQDFTQIDMFMIYRAIFAWINSIRAQINQNLFSPTNEEIIRIQIAGVRESKEFRETMKTLGLTRQERQKLRRKDFQIGIAATKATAQISLASQMAEAKKQNRIVKEEKNTETA